MATAMIVAASGDAALGRKLLDAMSGAAEVSLAPEPPDLCNMDMRAAAASAIKSAGAVILVVTETALKDPFVRFAAETARRNGAPLIPVLHQPIEAGALLTLTGGAEPIELDAPDPSSVPEGERALGVFEARHAEILIALLGPVAPASGFEAAPAAQGEQGLEALFDDVDDLAPGEAEPISKEEDRLWNDALDLDLDELDLEDMELEEEAGAAPGSPAPAPAAPAPKAARKRAAAPEPDAGGFRAAKLFENAPRRMRLGRRQEITVRISRDAAGGQGMTGSVSAHDILAAGAMTVTLDDPSFGYAIRPLTPSTQWVDRQALAGIGLGLEKQPAEWRWSVEPLKTGLRPLVIRASARVSDASGNSAEAGLPEQLVEIRVGVDPARAAKNAARWVLFAVGAGVLGHYSVEIIQTLNAFLG